MILRKIKFGSVLAALVMFFFPWVEVQCSGKPMLSQSGLQTIYGGGELSEEMQALGADTSPSGRERIDMALFVALALWIVLAAVVVSGRDLFRSESRTDLWGMLLPTVALALILLQMGVGFPVQNDLADSAEEVKPEVSGPPGTERDFDAIGAGFTAAMLSNIETKYRLGLYLELAFLGIPTLLLINGLIDRARKAEDG